MCFTARPATAFADPALGEERGLCPWSAALDWPPAILAVPAENPYTAFRFPGRLVTHLHLHFAARQPYSQSLERTVKL